MLFVDYTFSLAGDNIVMDAELSPKHLNVKTGDTFVVKLVEGDQIVFVKAQQGEVIPDDNA